MAELVGNEKPSPKWLSWTPEQVGFWLAEVLGLPDHAETFVSMKVTGLSLLKMTGGSLREEYLVEDPRDRGKILAGLRMLPGSAEQRSSRESLAESPQPCHEAQVEEESPEESPMKAQFSNEASTLSPQSSDSRSTAESASDQITSTMSLQSTAAETSRLSISIASALETTTRSSPSNSASSETMSVWDECWLKPQSPIDEKAPAPERSPEQVTSEKTWSLAEKANKMASSKVKRSTSRPLVGPLALHHGECATARRSSSRSDLRSGQEGKQLSRIESEKALRVSGKLDRLTDIARSLTPRRTTTPRQRAVTPRTSSRPVSPLRALSPRARGPFYAECSTTLAPFPCATFGKAELESRSPRRTYQSRFEYSPCPGTYTPRGEEWSPIAEGKPAPGVTPFGTQLRGSISPWRTRFEELPAPGAYSPRSTGWSPVANGKPAPGASAFSKAPRLGISQPSWLQTSG
eukprot:TRINITY_DN111755_c0_g1_i1.p1 TRINITY_DN111755_c0_g1~~TRINITY_DN111755_c0_g1_i1.p1  ORF type:complete len:463 (-),score=67.62 TRINITY_DN111755_c0_g1_i1:27-1415(-)